MAEKKAVGDAFGGRVTMLDEQRAIWADALHEDAENAPWSASPKPDPITLPPTI